MQDLFLLIFITRFLKIGHPILFRTFAHRCSENGSDSWF